MIEARVQVNRGSFFLDAEFSMPGRGVTALFGPSGSGKTTLLRAIAGLDRPSNAFLKMGDTVWQDNGTFVPPHRRSLGYVFQEGSLFTHCSVRKNLEYGFKRVREVRRRISFDRAVDLFQLSPLLARKPGDLSGGETRRVAIARALLTSPRLLLMDEPLSGLDMNRKAEILPTLEQLGEELDIPILYVSHLPDEVVRLADHLIYLRDGKVTAAGSMEETLTRLDLPLAHETDAGAMIRATVVGYEESFQLSTLQFAGGSITVARNLSPIGRKVRVRIPARDVSLTLSKQNDTSILNVLPATIEEIEEGGSAQVMIRLRVGESYLLSRITRKSMISLGLELGKEVFAQVKSVALLDEA
jgi:molybdate transport system ATP-binding protein